MKKINLNIYWFYWTTIKQSKLSYLFCLYITLLVIFVTNIDSQNIISASINEKNSTSFNSNSYNFTQYKNPTMGIEIIYPWNWEIENDVLIDFENIILIHPSTGIKFIENNESKIQHTTSATNILDILPFFVIFN